MNGSRPRVRSGLVAALDVGSTKVCCFIAKDGELGPQIVGIGHQVSEGVRGGVVVDMDAAEASIRAAVEAAEQMAGENVSSVMIGMTSGRPQSRLVSFEVSIGGHQITENDLRKLLDPAWLDEQQPQDRRLIHSIPVSYAIDGNRGVRDPRGMYGDRLSVNLHSVTISNSTLRNLETCIARCHLGVETVVSGPYASGLGCLVQDEIDLGVTVIDLGGGTTTLAVFYEGEVVHVDTVPVGGVHVTSDIARGLSTTLSDAERIKTLYGNTLASPSDDREVIKVHLVGEDSEHEAVQVPRSMLVGIIQPRVEETFELVRSRLEASGFDRLTGRHLVLTGGASQLTGVPEMASRMLDKQVRIGRPTGMTGLAEATDGPAFSACAGLLRYAMSKGGEHLAPLDDLRKREPMGPMGRIGSWLRENF
ncbi:MAG: cell division protein FtsA [Rhodospirillales bacterium]|nr:cell division protein FtsA [Rhodospirillales bacterium]MCW9039379.1 cell division protein FtsA [Rhodospirillales bacterium]